MALDDLIARLERDAEARLATLRADTDAELARLDAEAAAISSDHRAMTLEARRRSRRARLERGLVEARRDARAAVLERQHTLIGRVLERARQLEAAPSASWVEALPGLLDAALRYLHGHQVTVRCRSELAAIARSRLESGNAALVVEDAAMEPGCVVASADGSITIDLTLTALLRSHERAVVEAVLAGVSP